MPLPPARLPTPREAMLRRRTQMESLVAAIREQYLEPILARFPRMLPTKPDSAARYALYSAVIWFGIWALMAAVVALKLVFPKFLPQFAFFSYGRLRQAETNILSWGVLFMGAVGAAYAILPRVCGRKLWSERIGAQLVMLLDTVVVAGTVLIMIGRTQGIDGLEWPWPVDIALVMGMAGVLQVLMFTVTRRAGKELNSPARFIIAAFLVLPITYAVANFASPFVFGVKQTFYSGFGSAGFILAMSLIGIGSTLFVLPRATGNPIWSSKLATWTFWLMLATMPWLGLVQRVLGPAQDWTETIGIAFAIVATIPAVYGLVLTIATWRNGSRTDPASGFMLAGTALWALAIAQLMMGSFRHPAGILGATWWNEGVRAAFLGAFGLWLVGLTYHLIPRIRGRALRNPSLVRAHLWIALVGIVGAWLTASVAGLVQGFVSAAGGAAHIDLMTGSGWLIVGRSVKPFLIARLVAGGFVVGGIVMFLYNVQRTLAEGDDVALEVFVVEPVAEPVGSSA